MYPFSKIKQGIKNSHPGLIVTENIFVSLHFDIINFSATITLLCVISYKFPVWFHQTQVY